ncbi:MAG: hypothetical protein WBQ18_18600, partial [Solirubrobacteraceae bacterium]
MPEPSILDVRLAEIDRRLRTIQSGLAPAVVAKPASPAPALRAVPAPPAADAEADRLIARLHELVDEHERLLSRAGNVLAAAVAPTLPAAPAGPRATAGSRA